MLRSTSRAIALWLHRLFEASLVIKGLLASGEALAGLGLLWTSNALIVRFVDWMTRNELAQDPTDPMAEAARRAAETLSIQSQHFYAIYLLSHGLLKLLMVMGLARRIMWSYPAAMVVLAGFVVYQVYSWSISGSVVLIALSLFDLFMIGLVWREWMALRATEVAH